MVELGGMLAAAILKVVADQIGSAIGGQIKLHKNFEKELKKMKMALDSVDAVLKVAERRSITDEPTLLWLKRLKDAMYAISDMIDEFEADTQDITQPSARKFSFKRYLDIMIPCLTIGPKITMANKMEKMREDLEVITDQHNRFKLTEGTSANEPQVIDIRETTSTVEAQIIGRTKDKDEILACLSESTIEEITILSICGIGGLGKTTLAKMVYNSSQFKQYFQVWVYVSQTCDLKKIGNSIISQLSEEEKESEYTGMQMIHKSLQKLLAGKKILIVLDDLWEGDEFHLENLMDMLRVGKGGNVVVVVTTRDEGIANKISTIKPYKLAPLSDDMCWSIIKQKSAFESRGDKEQVEAIGKAIAVKCSGVALAAKSLGHMLKSMKSGEWESVRDSNIWTVSSLTDTSTQVLASLKLSYSVMPSYLKLCFAYCAIFPKGHKIVKDNLIHQWVSLGFSTWQLGERYINQLLGLSFLENTKSPSTIKLYHEDVILLTMHDLVHDLARSVMDDEILVAGKGNNAEGSYYHYALLDDYSKPLGSDSSRIRALRVMDCDKTELHDATFSSAKSLRVLDLSEFSINKLPESIGALKQLRYLNAPNVQHAIIPNSLTRLSKLIYLDLHGSFKIIALPESIGDIEGLSYLDLSGCSRIKELPESFGKLKELVHLDFSKCYLLSGISKFLGSLTQLKYLNLSYCHHIGKLPEALRGLSKLKYLNLSFSSYLDCCEEAEVLGSLTELEYLNLSSECCYLKKLPETLGFIQLKYLNLSGCEVIRELPKLRSLKNLVHLDLSYCDMIENLHEDLVSLSNLEVLNLESTHVWLLPNDLTKLRYLNLSDLSSDALDSLINHIGIDFSNLEHLDLSDNSYIRSIPESLCRLRKLQTLDLSNCTLLENLPEGVGRIDSLKFLDLNGCPNIAYLPQLSNSPASLPHFVVYPDKGDTSSNLIQLQHIDPVELQISKLENVKSTSEAHRINLMEKHSLQNLKLEWTQDVERFVDAKMLLQKLLPPSTLKILEIHGYNGVSFPAWLVGQLPNLQKLVLSGMASLVEWNTSYSIGEEHVIEELNIYDCPMLRMKPLPPKAKYWHISNSDSVLSSWEERTVSHTDASSFSSPVTTQLLVSYCQVPLHQWRLLQRLSGLTYLYIQNCGDLTSSPEIIQYLSSLETLCLQNKDLEELPNWLGELTSLQSLEIIECGELKKFSENMRKLTKLRSLKLFLCNRMESLPHWLGELTSLKKLAVEGCGVLKSLPESMQQLTSLQDLEISSCHELKHMFESKKGSLKFTPNHETVCGLPTSLKELKIRACYGIRSLPEGIYQLTGLQKLEISLCHQLKHVVESEEGNMKLTHTQERVCGLPTSLKELEIRYCGGIQSLPEGMRQLTNLQNLHIQGCNSLWEWCELKENKDMLKQLEKLVYHSVRNNSTSRASRDIEDTSDNRARMSLLMGDEESDRHRQKNRARMSLLMGDEESDRHRQKTT